MLLAGQTHDAHAFGELGRSLDAARESGFFNWFHLEATDECCATDSRVTRFRPSGPAFRDLCYLDVLTTDEKELVRLELVVRRTLLDGRDRLFGKDLVKSFLQASLTDACRYLLRDFLDEMSVPGGAGRTPGSLVFRGRQSAWNVETGWSRLALANLVVSDAPSLVVNVEGRPEVHAAEGADGPWYRRLHARWLSSRFWPTRAGDFP